ncbi:MAG: hypothetical protein JWL80_117 [Parcubacteria group bacterium]|nr:hypothetical protein [Parcubacteria group bacterium]
MESNNSSNSSANTVLISVIIIVIIALAFYFGFYHRGGTSSVPKTVDVNLNVPTPGGSTQ